MTCECERRGESCAARVYVGEVPSGYWICQSLLQTDGEARAAVRRERANSRANRTHAERRRRDQARSRRMRGWKS